VSEREFWKAAGLQEWQIDCVAELIKKPVGQEIARRRVQRREMRRADRIWRLFKDSYE